MSNLAEKDRDLMLDEALSLIDQVKIGIADFPKHDEAGDDCDEPLHCGPITLQDNVDDFMQYAPDFLSAATELVTAVANNKRGESFASKVFRAREMCKIDPDFLSDGVEPYEHASLYGSEKP